MDALHSSTLEDFKSTWFSNLQFFCDLLCNFKVSAIFLKRDIIKGGLNVDLRKIWGGFRKNCREGLWSAGWFSIKRRSFLQKKLDAHPIWTAGWFRNNLRCFLQNILRGPLERGLIFEKQSVFWQNDRCSPDLDRPRGRSNGHEITATWTRWLSELPQRIISLNDSNNTINYSATRVVWCHQSLLCASSSF